MKKVSISILISILIISIFTTVNAASASIALGASSDTVIKGKTFTVTVAGTADNNITGLQATLEYDTSKLEIQSKTAGENFTDASGSNSEIAILSTGSTVLKSGTLYNITFKVLDNAEVGNTTITVKNATLALVDENSTQQDITVATGDVTVTIKSDDTTVDNNNQGDAENKNDTENDGSSTTKTDNDNGSTSAKKDEGTKANSGTTSGKTDKNTNSEKYPQAGIENVSIVSIVLLGIISIASYVSYRKYKNI